MKLSELAQGSYTIENPQENTGGNLKLSGLKQGSYTTEQPQQQEQATPDNFFDRAKPGGMQKPDFSAATNLIGGAVSQIPKIGANVSSLMQYANPATRIGLQNAGENAQAVQQFGTSQKRGLQNLLGVNPEAPETKVGEVGAEIGSTMLLPGAGATKLPLLGRLARGAFEGAKDVTAYTAGSEGRLPTPGEYATSSLLGGALKGAGELGGKGQEALYRTAFGGVKKSLQEKGVNVGEGLAGDVIRKSGLESTQLAGLENEVKGRLQNTRDAIQSEAGKVGGVETNTIKQGLKNDLLDKMGISNLPKEAPNTQKLMQKVDEMISEYLPEGKISGQELVATIKNLNQTLPDKLVGMGMLDKKAGTALTQTMEKGIRNNLDDIIKKQFGESSINKLYQQYSKDKLVQSIIKDRQLQKIFARQLLLGGIGAGAGLGQIGQGDIVGGLKTSLLGGISGIVAGKISGNADLQMRIGKILGNLSKGAFKKTLRRVGTITPEVLSSQQK